MSERVTDERALEAAARLFDLLPAHIRDRDAREGRTLEALFRVLGGGSAEIDAELDRFFDALFVETAPDAALPAFAALVGAPSFAALPSGELPRALIANLLRYRRGKGTARILAELAQDVTQEGAVVVEYYQRVARIAHLIDVRPDRPAFADLRPGDMASRAGRAFDKAARLADLRSIARAAGRWHVPIVGAHLLRPLTPLFPAPDSANPTLQDVAGTPVLRPWPIAGTAHPGYWQLAAQLERKIRLFNPDRGAEAQAEGKGGRQEPHHLPDRLHRLPLHLETEELRHAALEGGSPKPLWFGAKDLPFALFARRKDENAFTRLRPEELLICNLEDAPLAPGSRPAESRTHEWSTGALPKAQAHVVASPILLGFDPATGRAIAPAPAAGQQEIVELRIAYAYGIGRPIGAGAQERNDDEVPFEVLDTDRLKNFVRVVDATAAAGGSASDRVRSVQTLSQALADVLSDGAGKRALIVFVRCDRETTAATVRVHPGTALHLVAAQWRAKATGPGFPDDPDRLGYLVRRERRFTVDAPVSVAAAAPPAANEDPGELILDGLELTRGLSLGANAVSHLWLRHTTLRNPGSAALTTAAFKHLFVRIDDSLSGPLALESGGGPGRINVSGSILSPDGAALPVLAAENLDARLCDVTLFGTARTKSVEATGCLFTTALTVQRKQEGCLRYSYLAPGSDGPRRFRCQPDPTLSTAAALRAAPVFMDTSLDEPACALLHPLCPDGIRNGGEGGTEMGSFGPWGASLRRANLTSLFDDFTPFGLETAILDDAQSAPQALRRNKP
ncbi:hypothetical protein N2599_18495 [Rhizobium sullae]|uniref:Uncharacterized protein n=1 Tax=Rhizobium sullae TaxID=50338 RepID=A0ABY5XHY3_RHISU|nr:hypothetical protein [Rhizobium sullae]UWU14080.1 hypothetical protein N2599_18495 [Rhizobium sullae]